MSEIRKEDRYQGFPHIETRLFTSAGSSREVTRRPCLEQANKVTAGDYDAAFAVLLQLSPGTIASSEIHELLRLLSARTKLDFSFMEALYRDARRAPPLAHLENVTGLPGAEARTSSGTRSGDARAVAIHRNSPRHRA